MCRLSSPRASNGCRREDPCRTPRSLLLRADRGPPVSSVADHGACADQGPFQAVCQNVCLKLPCSTSVGAISAIDLIAGQETLQARGDAVYLVLGQGQVEAKCSGCPGLSESAVTARAQPRGYTTWCRRSYTGLPGLQRSDRRTYTLVCSCEGLIYADQS